MPILFKYYADVENYESYNNNNNNNNNNNIQIIIIDIYIDKSKIQKIEMNFNPLKRYNLYFRKKKTLMKQVRKHNNFLTHCTIFINHIFLKSPVAKSEKKKRKKEK